MRVVGYCRTSTEGQCGEDKFGIESQRRAIIGYCQEHDMEIVEWFIDEAVSGASLNPPAFNTILNGGIKNPPIEAVVVAKADRVARDIEKYFGFKFLFQISTIKYILDNRKTYEGFYKYGDGSWVQGKHPAILEEVEMNGGKIS